MICLERETVGEQTVFIQRLVHDPLLVYRQIIILP
jgi:hypothetical protein